MLRVKCPHCGRSAKASAELADRSLKCSSCGKVLQIPQIPVVTSFVVKREWLSGNYFAAYRCPHCDSPLRSSEREIEASEDSCPECNKPFRVTEDAIGAINSRRAKDKLAAQRQREEKIQRLRGATEGLRGAAEAIIEPVHEIWWRRQEMREAKVGPQTGKDIKLEEQMDTEKRDQAAKRETKNASKESEQQEEQRELEATTTCPFCKERILMGAIKCKHCHSDLRTPANSSTNGDNKLPSTRHASPPAGPVTGLFGRRETKDNPIRCPRWTCRSTRVHAEKRGWTWSRGFFGSSQIVITCLACGHRFKPGQQLSTKVAEAWAGALAILAMAMVSVGYFIAYELNERLTYLPMSSTPTTAKQEPAQSSGGIPETKPVVRIKHATIQSPSGDYVPVTFNMEDEERLVKLSVAGDLLGIQQMVDAGKVVTIEHGTECVVIDLGFSQPR